MTKNLNKFTIALASVAFLQTSTAFAAVEETEVVAEAVCLDAQGDDTQYTLSRLRPVKYSGEEYDEDELEEYNERVSQYDNELWFNDRSLSLEFDDALEYDSGAEIPGFDNLAGSRQNFAVVGYKNGSREKDPFFADYGPANGFHIRFNGAADAITFRILESDSNGVSTYVQCPVPALPPL